MSYRIEHNVSLVSYSSMRIGGIARVLYVVSDVHSLPEVFEDIERQGILWMVVGEGSNTVFADGEHALALIQITDTSLEYDERWARVRVGAGIIWDDLVAWCTERDLQGIESSSAIPGTVGAAPVQNIGAYGAQLSDVCIEVEVYDTVMKKFRKLSASECHFTYRDSIFKHATGKHLIITAVTLQLQKSSTAPIPKYPDAQKYFSPDTLPTVSDVRNAITKIRWQKLPKPSELPNTGSFFKNPIVAKSHIHHLQSQQYEIPSYPTHDPDMMKTSAGWLIEQVNLKGYRMGNIGTYDKHALVIVNHEGKASYTDLRNCITHIQEKVYEKFGIQLELEVNIII